MLETVSEVPREASSVPSDLPRYAGDHMESVS